jgi:hypothetical protein
VKPTVQRFRLIGITVLSILVFTIIGATSPAHATVCTVFTATLSSSTIVQGGSLTLSGVDNCSPITGENIFANTYETSSCPSSGMPSGSQVGGDGLSGVTGAYSGVPITFFISPPGFGGPGTYCVHVFSTSDPSGANVAFTVTSPTFIPEYPFGLAVLAIFMILAYGIIRRRTRSNLR